MRWYYESGIDTVIRAVKRMGADITLLSESVLNADQERHLRQLVAPSTFAEGRRNAAAIALSGKYLLREQAGDVEFFAHYIKSLKGP